MELLTFAHYGEAQVFIKNDLFKPAQFIFKGLYKNKYRFLLLTGEGLVSTSRKLNAVLAVSGAEISRIINLGVAGALDEKIELYSIHSIRKVFSESNKEFFISADDRAENDCVSSNNRVMDKHCAEKLRSIAPIVDRELWACAEVCHKYQLPFVSIKLISDVAGSINTDQVIKRAKEFSEKLYKHFQHYY